MHVGDGTWDTEMDTFLLPNLVGLNFDTMRYNGKAHSTLNGVAFSNTHRHGKPVSRHAAVSKSHSCPWRHRSYRFPLDCTVSDPHLTLPQSEYAQGAENTHMAPDLDFATHNGGFYNTILCGWSEEELDESTSWYWIDDFRSGTCPIHRWLVGS